MAKLLDTDDILDRYETKAKERTRFKLAKPLYDEQVKNDRAEAVVNLAESLMRMKPELELEDAIEMARKIRNEEEIKKTA